MRHLNKFEDFKYKFITQEDIINCIKNSGYIYTKIVKDLPESDSEEPIRPLSVDNDGLITVEIGGKEYEVDLKNVEKIDS